MKTTLNLQGRLVSIDKPLIMGILNLTYDSFYDGGKYNTIDSAIIRAEEILEEGGDIIDIGACSTRPGAILVPKEEEIERIIPVLREIRKRFPNAIISIDTVWAEVVKQTIDNGANIINDISGGQFDQELFKQVALSKAPYVLMHTPSTPDIMQKNTTYENLYLDICKYFSQKINLLKQEGVMDIILDLGFGFGKTIEQNYELMRRMDEFMVFELPLLTGISRKSMIYKALKITAEESLNSTTALNTIALEKGTKILRVHDVKEAVQTRDIIELVKGNIQTKI